VENETRQTVGVAGNGKPPKVAVCCPSGDQVASLFCHDFARMMGFTIRNRPEIDLMSLFMPGSLIPKQREALAEEVLQTDYTHLLWLDTDMRFPPDTILRMLNHHKRIVAANYVERRPPFKPVAFPQLQRASTRLYTEETSTGLVEVQAVGTGVMMVETDVFRQLPRPWFCVGWVKETQEFVGEDVFFCETARRNGEHIWLDHDLSKEVGHVGSFTFTFEHARQARGMMAESQNGNAQVEGAVA
jgi:hypothetical protein